MKTPLRGGEVLLRHGFGNMWRGPEAVGGRLYLTSQRLVFEPHSFNVQKAIATFDLADVTGVEKSGTLVLVPNGLTVHFADGTSARFVVWRRGRWLAAIASARGIKS